MREHYSTWKTIEEANRITNTFFENGMDADWEAYTLLDYASKDVRIGEIRLEEKIVSGTDVKMYRPVFNFEVIDTESKLTMDEAYAEAERIKNTVYSSAEEALEDVNNLKDDSPDGFEVDHCFIDRSPVFEKDNFVYTANFEASVYYETYDDHDWEADEERESENNFEFVKSVEVVQTTDGSPLYYNEFGPYKLINLRKGGPLSDVHQEFNSTDDFLLNMDGHIDYIVYPLVVTEDEKNGETHIEVKKYSYDTMVSKEVNAVVYANADNPDLQSYSRENLFRAIQDYEYWMNDLGWEVDLYDGPNFVETRAGFYGSEESAVRDMIADLKSDGDNYYDDFCGLLKEGMYCSCSNI